MFTLLFRNYVFLLIVWTLSTQSLLYGQEKVTGSFTDPRDGKTYKTVNIGGRWWMAENLNYVTEEGSWCMDGDADGSQYGRFCNWETAKVVPPPGWHLPSKKEFQTLLDSVGDSRKERYQGLIKGGESGFDAILTGGHMGKLGKQGESALFWSSSLWWFSSLVKIIENPWGLFLSKLEKSVWKDYVILGHGVGSNHGFNVRCVKDE